MRSKVRGFKRAQLASSFEKTAINDDLRRLDLFSKKINQRDRILGNV